MPCLLARLARLRVLLGGAACTPCCLCCLPYCDASLVYVTHVLTGGRVQVGQGMPLELQATPQLQGAAGPFCVPSCLQVLRMVDEIYVNTIKEFGLYDEIWQAFAVFLPIKSVGVQGDQRTHR